VWLLVSFLGQSVTKSKSLCIKIFEIEITSALGLCHLIKPIIVILVSRQIVESFNCKISNLLK